MGRDQPASGPARTKNGMTAFILNPDDPLYKDPAVLEQRRRSRLLRSEQPFARVKLSVLLDSQQHDLFAPKIRLYLFLQIKTLDGRKPVRLTNAIAADLGLSRQHKIRCLRQLEAVSAVRVEWDEQRVPLVWWQG